jgi:hypothetical protein
VTLRLSSTGYEAVMGILDRHIQGEVDWNQFVRLDVLGLDEISLKKGAPFKTGQK